MATGGALLFREGRAMSQSLGFIGGADWSDGLRQVINWILKLLESGITSLALRRGGAPVCRG
jgi:hypothetical protein